MSLGPLVSRDEGHGTSVCLYEDEDRLRLDDPFCKAFKGHRRCLTSLDVTSWRHWTERGRIPFVEDFDL